MQSKLLSTPAIAVILVCFFLPWVTVSCRAYGNVSEIELTGYELATGKEIGRFGDKTEADAAVFLGSTHISVSPVVDWWIGRPTHSHTTTQFLREALKIRLILGFVVRSQLSYPA